MASNINPNNIDTTYPIAGQDNDSQGFRDNFTNIKTNFEYAESEIDDLQAKVILKSALSGASLDNDFNGALVENAKTRGFRADRNALGSVSGSNAIDFNDGNVHTLTTTGSVSLTFSNFPAAGSLAEILVRITVANVSHTLTLPSAVGTGAAAQSVAGIQGWSSNVITFAETGTYEFVFHTDDGGTTIYLSENTRPRADFMNPIFLGSSEDLADAAAASLSVTASYFSTSGVESATLAAGVNGQIKTFMMAADSGNMVITVTNAGWKSSGTGTITFDDIGDACTLQYVNNKWYAIGVNGVTFA